MNTAPILNLHMLHSFPASLLNRDEHGNAKAITVGNTRRDRVSSQAFRRAMRLALREKLQAGTSVVDGTWGVRTNRLPRLVTQHLVTEYGRDSKTATVATTNAFVAMKLKLNDRKNDQTSSQLYVSEQAESKLSALINSNFTVLEGCDDPTKLDADLVNSMHHCLDPDRAVDIALFGRFLADVPINKRVDGAVGVSHAFGVTPATLEMDFWTAVDDVQQDTDTASSNLGIVDLTAPVFYRHVYLDLRQLDRNLAGTGLDTAAVARDFLRIAATASPSAKKTGTAANTLPSLIVATVGDGNYSAADAFTTPITTTDVLAEATNRLMNRLDTFRKLGVDHRAVALSLSPETGDATEGAQSVRAADSIDEAIENLLGSE